MEDGVGDMFDHFEDLLDFFDDEGVPGMVESRGGHNNRYSISSLGSFADQLLGSNDDGKDSPEDIASENKKFVNEN